MYWNEHNPPHFHAQYQGKEALINIKTLNVVEGDLPRRGLSLVLDWAELHQDELIRNWHLCESKNHPNKIQPLI